MIAAMLLATMLAQTPAASPAPPPPVTEWPALPFYALPRSASLDNGVAFVRDEIAAGRCRPHPTLSPTEPAHLHLPVAILVGDAGQVRQIVPQAIGCPSIEQFTVGYLLSLTRGTTDSSAGHAPGWYQLTVNYRW